jgi:activating signal cointegrator complex subunit 1
MPTHFISLPLGHHEELQRRARALTDSWLAFDPAVDGLDRSIVIPPRRLHLTLGVMALSGGNKKSHQQRAPQPTVVVDPRLTAENEAGEKGPPPELPTLERAKQVLDSCIPDVNDILNSNGGVPLRLTLDQLGTFQTNREQCHVLFAEPRDAEDGSPGLLRAIGGRSPLFFTALRLGPVVSCVSSNVLTSMMARVESIEAAFKRANLITDERPLAMHATLLNTSKRKPLVATAQDLDPPRQTDNPPGKRFNKRVFSKRVPFDASRLLSLPGAYEAVAQAETSISSSSGVHSSVTETSVTAKVAACDLGTYEVDQVQLCEMGSFDAEGAYVVVHRAPFGTPNVERP